MIVKTENGGVYEFRANEGVTQMQRTNPSNPKTYDREWLNIHTLIFRGIGEQMLFVIDGSTEPVVTTTVISVEDN